MFSHLEQFSQRFKVCLPPAVPPIPLHIADVKEDSRGRIHIAGHHRFDYIDLEDGDVLPVKSCFVIRDLALKDGVPDWLDSPVKLFTPLSTISDGGVGLDSSYVSMNSLGDIVFAVTALDFDALKEGEMRVVDEEYYVSYAGHDGYYVVPNGIIPHSITENRTLLVHRQSEDGSYEGGIFNPGALSQEEIFSRGAWASGVPANILATGSSGVLLVERTIRGGARDGEIEIGLKMPKTEHARLLKECTGVVAYGGKGITLGVREKAPDNPFMSGEPMSAYWNAQGEWGALGDGKPGEASRYLAESITRLSGYKKGEEGAFCFVGSDLATSKNGEVRFPDGTVVPSRKGGGVGVIWYATDSELQNGASLEPLELGGRCPDDTYVIESARAVTPNQFIVAEVADGSGDSLSALLVPEKFWR